MSTIIQQLKKQLSQGLAPVTLLAGDEPLLMQEARDLILHQAQNEGYTERRTIHPTSSIDWEDFEAEISQGSLFSTKMLIELRIHNGKPGKTGSAAIETYCDNLPRDKILLIVTPKLEAAQQKSKWVKGIEEKGLFMNIRPLEQTQLPHWIKARLQKESLSTSPEGIDLLADQTQGNLLACDQEITKLSLLYGEKHLSEAEISEAVGDQARFDLYTLIDQALLGKSEAAVRILSQLKEAGTEPTLILWGLTRELRQLIQLSALTQKGERFDRACAKLFVWKTRQSLYQSALTRLKQTDLLPLLNQATRIDLIIKGLESGNVWLALNQVVLGLTGKTLPTESLPQ